MDTPNLPQDTQIHRLSIPDTYKENAVALVKKMIKGNRYDPENLTLEEFEGSILQFQAENRITILKKINHLRKPGRIGGPVKVENETMAQEEMHKAYMTLHDDINIQRQIKDGFLKRDDQGFALDQTVVPLTIWKKEFVAYEPCQTCQTTGSVKCLPCSGEGIEPCPRCKGAGLEHCTQCRGAQTIHKSDGTSQQCPRCHGQGQTSCSSCNQTGRIPCKVCQQKGSTTCQNCNGNAWISHIYVIEIEARTAFDYPKDRLPEKVVAMIEKYGANIKSACRYQSFRSF